MLNITHKGSAALAGRKSRIGLSSDHATAASEATTMSEFTRYSGTGVVSELIQRERIEATGVRRIKRITSHAGHARYLATLADTGKEIARIAAIPSPYAYSPRHTVYHVVEEDGSNVIIVETAHKQYDVFVVPTDAVLLPAEVA